MFPLKLRGFSDPGRTRFGRVTRPSASMAASRSKTHIQARTRETWNLLLRVTIHPATRESWSVSIEAAGFFGSFGRTLFGRVTRPSASTAAVRSKTHIQARARETSNLLLRVTIHPATRESRPASTEAAGCSESRVGLFRLGTQPSASTAPFRAQKRTYKSGSVKPQPCSFALRIIKIPSYVCRMGGGPIFSQYSRSGMRARISHKFRYFNKQFVGRRVQLRGTVFSGPAVAYFGRKRGPDFGFPRTSARSAHQSADFGQERIGTSGTSRATRLSGVSSSEKEGKRKVRTTKNHQNR